MARRATSHGVASSRGQRVVLVAALVVTALAFVALRDLDGEWGSIAYNVATSSAAVVGWLGYRLNRPITEPWVWRLSLAGLGLYALGDWVWYASYSTTVTPPAPGLPDIPYLGGVICLLLSGLALGRHRLGARHADTLIDTVSIAAPLVLLLWPIAVKPAFVGAPLAQQLILGSYPVVDLVIVAVAVRIVSMRAARSWPASLVGLSALLLLIADTTYTVAVQHGWYDANGTWLDLLFVTAVGTWALQFVVPSIETAAAPVDVPAGRISRGRLALAGVALVAPAAAAVADHDRRDGPPTAVLAMTAVIVTTAVLVRVRRLSLESAASRDGLAAAYDDLARTNEELERSRRLVLAQRAYFADLVEHASDAVLTIAADGVITSGLGSVHNLFGRTANELIGRNVEEVIHRDDLARVAAAFEAVLAAPSRPLVIECRSRRPEGGRGWMTVRIANRLVDSPVNAVVMNISDATARKSAERALFHQARHDVLTGLGNRSHLEEQLARALLPGRHVGVLFLDLDRFKVVNDSLGYASGDRLLRTVAHRLTTSTRPDDIVFRLGGDEFCVLVREHDGGSDGLRSDLEDMARRLLAVSREPVVMEGLEIVIGASIGLAVGGPGETASDVLRHADLALDAARSAGRDCVRTFDDEMQRLASDRLTLESELRDTLRVGGLEVHYQPIVDLRTGQIASFEALVRWPRSSLGPIGPDRFIPIAEESGLIVPLGAWVLAQACATGAAMRAVAPDGRDIPVAVNLSSVQLRDERLLESVEQILRESGLPPHLLTLELTESTLVSDPLFARHRLNALQRLGVRTAIDDFGTGYSSLSYLREFSFDILKIDRSFLGSAIGEPDLPAIVRSVLDLGPALGMRTVAEGIETAEQLDALRSSTCEYGQGYLFSPAVPEAAALALVAGGTVFAVGGIRPAAA